MMQATLRLILNFLADVGATPNCAFDSANPPNVALTLSGFEENTAQNIVLPVAAVDQVLAFTDIPMILLESDQPFFLRVAAGETLLGPLRVYLLWGSDPGTGVLQTNVLLSNQGTNQAIIKAYTIEV